MKTPHHSRAITLSALLLTALAGCQHSAPPAEPKAYAFWPLPPDEPRVQFLTSFSTSSDIARSQSKFDDMIYGKAEAQQLPISKPYGVAMWNGRIYICDVRGTGIVVLDLRKKETRVMGGSGMGALGRAVDVTVAPDGTKYVADITKGSVCVFDPEERFVRLITAPELNPVGVAVFGNELYACDLKARMVKVFDRTTGAMLRTIGKPGGEDGQFVGPLSVVADNEGNIYVTDVMKARIQKFAKDGTLLLAFGQAGERPGDLNKPKHLGVSDGITYVADAAFNNVQLFDEEGKVMMYFGSFGTHPGAMDLPAGLCVHDGDLDLFQQYVHPAFNAERLLLVTNQFGPNKVSVYALGKLREGKTLADISPGRATVATGLADPKSEPAVPATQPTTQPAKASASGSTTPR